MNGDSNNTKQFRCNYFRIRMLRSRFIFLLVFFIFVYPQNIADARQVQFDDGVVAYKKGDYKTAAKKFNEAAEKGDYRAMYALGTMYIEGKGVDKDNKKAYKWFKEAAGYNFPYAEYKLGLMYGGGIVVSQNYKKAARFYKKAAKQGNAPAQFRLGLLYAKGHGVKQSNVKAYAWLVVAGAIFSCKLCEVKEESAETKQNTDELETEHKQLEDLFPATMIMLDWGTRELRRIRKELTPEQVEETKQLIQTYIEDLKKYTIITLEEGQPSSEDRYLYFPEYFNQPPAGDL